jgi:sRNA-binding protein
MRPAVLAFAAAGLFLTWLALDAGRAPVLPPPLPARARTPARAAAAPAEMPRRNVFEYESASPVPRPAPAFVPRLPAPAEAPAPSPEPPVRLVGLVRRAGGLRAALAIAGETVVVGAGETAGDYIVIAVEEDGVRLRTADGVTITLRPGP